MGGRDLKDPFLSVYGHVTVDQIISIDEFLPPGITADALSKKTTLGGTGPNIAVAAAKILSQAEAIQYAPEQQEPEV